LEFIFRQERPERSKQEFLVAGTQRVPVVFVRNRLARRYILRVQKDGSARVTVPRGGTQIEARLFANRHAGWVEDQLRKRLSQPACPTAWLPGSIILFRGELAAITVAPTGQEALLADQTIPVPDVAGDLRPAIEQHLWRLAREELVPRTLELAAIEGLRPRRIMVRNQRSRWGSSSVRGTIALNWRLIQTPDWVRDYIILHELTHFREMSHSSRFWELVEQACPSAIGAEVWLKQHRNLLKDGI
jgi:predicted metal-dependent hydrolase